MIDSESRAFGPLVWNASELGADLSWRYRLTKAQQKELDTAFNGLPDGPISDINPKLFPIEGVKPWIDRALCAVERERGVFLLRGLPVANKDIEQVERLSVALTSYLGKLLYQNPYGSLVGRVFDHGLDYTNIAVVGSKTNATITPHCDTGDLLILICVSPAQKGGTTNLVSTGAVYNEVLKIRPEYLELLFKGFHHNIRDRGPPGKWANVTRHKIPVFVNVNGTISSRFNVKAILTAEDWGLTEPLSTLEREAVKFVGKIARRKDLRYGIKLKAGDCLIVNNRSLLHYRTRFQDGAKKRMLLRIWANTALGRDLPASVTDHWNTGPNGTIYQRDRPQLIEGGGSGRTPKKEPASATARHAS